MSPLMIPLILNPKFALGTLSFTIGVQTVAENKPEFAKFIVTSIQRHANCDWGDLDDHDKAENEFSLKTGFRLLSAYKQNGNKIWIITEHDRSSTTILFPNEY